MTNRRRGKPEHEMDRRHTRNHDDELMRQLNKHTWQKTTEKTDSKGHGGKETSKWTRNSKTQYFLLRKSYRITRGRLQPDWTTATTTSTNRQWLMRQLLRHLCPAYSLRSQAISAKNNTSSGFVLLLSASFKLFNNFRKVTNNICILNVLFEFIAIQNKWFPHAMKTDYNWHLSSFA